MQSVTRYPATWRLPPRTLSLGVHETGGTKPAVPSEGGGGDWAGYRKGRGGGRAAWVGGQLYLSAGETCAETRMARPPAHRHLCRQLMLILIENFVVMQE